MAGSWKKVSGADYYRVFRTTNGDIVYNKDTKTYGYENAGTYMILGLAGINFLIELGTNIVLAPVITQLIRLGKK